jgi:hypothetical protein
MKLPDYDFQKANDNSVSITFKPPVTKAALGIPFSFLVLQQPTTEIKATRFDRIERIECETSRWISYLTTRGIPEERIAEFKSKVGWVDPEPPAPAAEEKESKPAAEEKAEAPTGS